MYFTCKQGPVLIIPFDARLSNPLKIRRHHEDLISLSKDLRQVSARSSTPILRGVNRRDNT